MDRQTVLEYAKGTPFNPVVLHLTDGQALHIRHPECLGVGENILALRAVDDSKHIVGFDQIVSIEYFQSRPKESGR